MALSNPLDRTRTSSKRSQQKNQTISQKVPFSGKKNFFCFFFNWLSRDSRAQTSLLRKKVRQENKLKVSPRNANDLFKQIFRMKRKATTKPPFDEDVLGKFPRKRKSFVEARNFFCFATMLMICYEVITELLLLAWGKSFAKCENNLSMLPRKFQTKKWGRKTNPVPGRQNCWDRWLIQFFVGWKAIFKSFTMPQVVAWDGCLSAMWNPPEIRLPCRRQVGDVSSVWSDILSSQKLFLEFWDFKCLFSFATLEWNLKSIRFSVILPINLASKVFPEAMSRVNILAIRNRCKLEMSPQASSCLHQREFPSPNWACSKRSSLCFIASACFFEPWASISLEAN